MDSIKVKTPLNVNVEVSHAGVGRRILAWVIDQVIIVIYIIGILYIFYDIFGLDFGSGNIFDSWDFLEIILTLMMFPAFLYSLWTETLFKGQTFGKMIMRIRVVKLNGYKASFPEYFTRWIFRFIDFWTGNFLFLFFIPFLGLEVSAIFSSMLMMMPGLVALILVVRSKNSQRLGDIVAGTTVLKLREKQSISITILEDIQETYVPRYSQVIRLSDNDARIIKDTFILARKRRDYRTMERLRKRLETVMDIEAEQSDIEFVDTVLKDFNYYTQKM